MDRYSDIKQLVLLLVVFSFAGSSAFGQQGTTTCFAFSNSGNSYSVSSVIVPVARFHSADVFQLQAGSPALFTDDINEQECTVNGLVHTSDSLLTYGMFYIIDSLTKTAVDSFIIRQGSFNLINIPVGTYHLLAVPLGMESSYYVPTYYVSKTVLEESTPVKVDEGIIHAGDIDIWLIRSALGKGVGMEQNELLLYPNPAHNRVIFQCYSPASSTALITFNNVSGTFRKQIEIHMVEGNNTMEVDISDLDEGMYVLSIISDHVVIRGQRFLKL